MSTSHAELDRELFRHSFVVVRSRVIVCDWRTYIRELAAPGSVRGLVGERIRSDIELQRRLLAHRVLARVDAYRDIVDSRRFEAKRA